MNSDARDIVARTAKVLREMRMLSEAGVAKLGGDRVSSGGSKSAPPPGVRFGHRSDLRDLSLADYWTARLRSARNVRQQHTFLYLAELDLRRAKVKQPARDPYETKEQREKRIMEQYDGLTPLEAALAEDCSEAYIRKVRVAHGPQEWDE